METKTVQLRIKRNQALALELVIEIAHLSMIPIEVISQQIANLKEGLLDLIILKMAI